MSDECDSCELLRTVLASRKDIRFLDVNDPEAERFLGDAAEAPVPSALIDGRPYAVVSDGEAIALVGLDEGDRVDLCKVRIQGDAAFVDCGQGEVRID